MTDSTDRSRKGMSDTAPYKAWKNMKAAVDTPSNPGYPTTGGKGIGYVANWKRFEGFWKDMRATYQEGARLVRVNKSLWFSPGNCVWQPADGSAPPKRDNSASGVRGVREYTDRNGYKFWTVRYTKDGRRTMKMFSLSKYGDMKAYMLAVCFFRKLKKTKKHSTKELL